MEFTSAIYNYVHGDNIISQNVPSTLLPVISIVELFPRLAEFSEVLSSDIIDLNRLNKLCFHGEWTMRNPSKCV